MPTNAIEIRKALDAFEIDDFDKAKEILKKEINNAVKNKIENELNIDDENFEIEDEIEDNDDDIGEE